jgi:hypothetical protein
MKLSTLAATLAFIPGMVAAGEFDVPALTDPLPVPVSDGGSILGSAVSGSLSLDYNSHFISYGADVWGGGDDLSDAIFNPSLELTFQLTENVSFILGTWWDVNDNAVSDIGGSIQEVDIWAGLGFGLGPVDVTVLYQEWLYGGESERILDVILGIDAPLSPTLTLHNRLTEGASDGDTGLVAVLGLEHGFEFGPVEFAIPLNVAGATDGFHGGDSGFAYASLGLNATLPLSVIDEKLGAWNLHGGFTYYVTDEDVIPNNPDDNFLTASFGIGIDF